jgi:hypothetical protein
MRKLWVQTTTPRKWSSIWELEIELQSSALKAQIVGDVPAMHKAWLTTSNQTGRLLSFTSLTFYNFLSKKAMPDWGIFLYQQQLLIQPLDNFYLERVRRGCPNQDQNISFIRNPDVFMMGVLRYRQKILVIVKLPV